MKDNEVIDMLVADAVAALSSPALPFEPRVLGSTGAEDLVFRDVEGQLPAVGVTDTGLDRVGDIGIGTKRWTGRVEVEITLAAAAEGDSSVAGRDQIRALLGEVNKRLDYRQPPNQKYRFKFLGFSYLEQPRLNAVVGVLRYEVGGTFGNE